ACSAASTAGVAAAGADVELGVPAQAASSRASAGIDRRVMRWLRMRWACRVNRHRRKYEARRAAGLRGSPTGEGYSIDSAAFSVADGRIAAANLAMSGW